MNPYGVIRTDSSGLVSFAFFLTLGIFSDYETQKRLKMKNKKISSELPVLDEILIGGFVHRSINLLRGAPGVGKTTFGLHFLKKGIQ